MKDRVSVKNSSVTRWFISDICALCNDITACSFTKEMLQINITWHYVGRIYNVLPFLLQMKTVSVALVLCLNIGVDPPDVMKTSPCARMECWIGKWPVNTAMTCA